MHRDGAVAVAVDGQHVRLGDGPAVWVHVERQAVVHVLQPQQHGSSIRPPCMQRARRSRGLRWQEG